MGYLDWVFLTLFEVKSLIRIQLFVTPWTEVCQAPPFMGFSRQEYWSGLPLPSPELLSRIWQILKINERGFSGGTVLKNLPANTGDEGFIPGSGRSPGEENCKSLHYSCLGNPMDRGAWWLNSMGSQRVRYDWVTEHTQTNYWEEINSLRDKWPKMKEIQYSNKI